MTVVIGLDLSLTSTGIAGVRSPGSPGTISAMVTCVKSKGSVAATLDDRARRLDALAAEITGQVVDVHPDLVLVEGPSYGSQTGSQHDRSGLWWIVVMGLRELGYQVVEVPPSCRMKYATGKGNAAKDAVLAAVVRRYAGVEVTGNDEADALVLAAMGARWLGHPIEDSLPQTHLAAMAKVQWPEVQPT